MDFEYDWVTKKRKQDELAKLKFNPSLITTQIFNAGRAQKSTG